MTLPITVIIATCNRYDSLKRTLRSLSRQTYPIEEILIIDASQKPLSMVDVQTESGSLKVRIMLSTPSVCIQRNLGVCNSLSAFVLICDDDIELPPVYIEKLVSTLLLSPAAIAVSGVISDKTIEGLFIEEFRPISPTGLFYHFIFQLPVWSDLSRLKPPTLLRPLFKALVSFYRRQGNDLTLAGWPLITNLEGDFFRSTIHGLGACLISREQLLASPFDEVLDPHGIGDNYGVAVGFRSRRSILVAKSAIATHHRSNENRLDEETVYFRRILALHYFMLRASRFSTLNRIFFLWSLVGNLLTHLKTRSSGKAYATLRAISLVLTGRNPYYMGFMKNAKQVSPTLSLIPKPTNPSV